MKTLLKVTLTAAILLYFGNGISLAGKHCSLLNWGSCEAAGNAHSVSSHSQSTGGNTGGNDPGGSTGTPSSKDHDDNGKGNGGEPGQGHGKGK